MRADGTTIDARLRSALILGCLSLVACQNQPYQRVADIGCSRGIFDAIPAFSYDRTLESVRVDAHEIEIGKHWSEYSLVFEGSDFPESEGTNAEAFYFVPAETISRSPAVILLAPTAGPIGLMRRYGLEFAKRGYTVAAFKRRRIFPNPDEPVATNVNLVRQSVIDVRRALDYLLLQQHVDPSRIGLMGISLGGMIGALVSESDTRIAANVMLVSGAHPVEILVSSSYPRIKKLRKNLMDRHGVDEAGLGPLLAGTLDVVDPATYSSRLDSAGLLMITGRFDRVIKPAVSDRSWETFGRPSRYVTPMGHFATISAIPAMAKRAHEHFESVFERSSERADAPAACRGPQPKPRIGPGAHPRA